MLHVITIILAVLFLLILIVSVIIFITINNKPKSVTRIKEENVVNRLPIDVHVVSKKKRIRRSKKCALSEEDDNPKVINICNYSRYTVYLMDDHSLIIQKDNKNRKIRPTLHITAITVYEGLIYAIANGRLYKLDNNTLENEEWEWLKVEWSPENVLEFSVPHDKNSIWVRCKDVGYLFDNNGVIIDSIKTPQRRVYGQNKDNYLTIEEKGNGLLQPGNKVFKDIKDAVISHDGELFILNKSNREYRMIKLVNWKPYYIV